ncbi:MAG: GNAT family N-acetyltransferase, partial [Alphaproteobacteria bacterium]|nr:GNAT family N-acetyltransferase [Alphaproteobacteria bacterium]
MSEGGSYTAKAVAGIDQIGAADWDRLAGTANPFLSYAFLSALEDSGCCAAETGWLPRHVVVEDETGKAVGAMPAYLKSHSHGEYVFDHGWADAYERAGGRYYPKLQASVPFTPATGPRLLTEPGPDAAELRDMVLRAAVQMTAQLKASSLHITYPTEEEWQQMGEAGLLLRTGEQFHWRNQSFGDFDDFLATLTARKRKMIRKERARATANGIDIRILSGGDLTPAHWDAFYAFYMDTGSRKWGAPYLNRDFFALLHERLADRVALVMCERAGRWIAGALNLIGDDTLYGRNWGCLEDHDCL